MDPNSPSVLITDAGFSACIDRYQFYKLSNADEELPVDVENAIVSIDISVETLNRLLVPNFEKIKLVKIEIPSFSDGRGFTLAKQLRLFGYKGVLRASGHLISDQYTMARRCGFDEIEIDANHAKRQPESEWIFRSDWQANDYQSRLKKDY